MATGTSAAIPADGESASAAVLRGEQAAARASELRRRLLELVGGAPPTLITAELARHRAREAAQRAASAHRSALTRHDETRQVHLRAAAAHEQAAVMLNRLDSDRHQSAAERHREAAAHHEAILAAFAGPRDRRRRSGDGLGQ